MIVEAVNWNSGSSHMNRVQKPWQEMKKNTWFALTTSLTCWLRLCLYTTNGVPLQMWGHLLPRKRQSLTSLNHLIWQFKGWSWSITAPTAKPDFQDSSTLYWAHPGTPEMWQVTQGHARWIGGLSHQSSNLSCLCNLLQKIVICAYSDTRFEGIQVVNYPAN